MGDGICRRVVVVPTESGLKPFSKSSTRFRDLGCILASATSFFFSFFFKKKALRPALLEEDCFFFLLEEDMAWIVELVKLDELRIIELYSIHQKRN